MSDDWLAIKSAIPQSVLLVEPPSISITVQVTDNGEPALTFTKQFVLQVTDIDEGILPNLVLTPRTVFDNATVGTVVGRIRIHNSSLEAGSLEFTLLDDADGLFELDEDKVVVRGILNHARYPSYQIVVQGKSQLLPGDITVMQAFTVVVVPSVICPDGCDLNSRCILGEDDEPTCACVDDAGDSEETQCSSMDDTLCVNNTCRFGICFGQGDDFVCECEEGFSGRLCELQDGMTNPCSAQPCLNDGTICRPTPDDQTSYVCSCGAGWEGTYCEESVDDCVHAICYGDSECLDQHQTYTCQCSDGYEGLRCEFSQDACSDIHSCSSLEICVPKFNEAGHFCVADKNNRIVVEFNEGVDEEFKARFLDFFYDVVDVFIESPGSMKKTRKKRDIGGSEVYVYIITSDQGSLDFVLLTKDGFPYTEEEALEQYAIACERIRTDTNGRPTDSVHYTYNLNLVFVRSSQKVSVMMFLFTESYPYLSATVSDESAPFCSELEEALALAQHQEEESGTSALVCVLAVAGKNSSAKPTFIILVDVKSVIFKNNTNNDASFCLYSVFNCCCCLCGYRLSGSEAQRTQSEQH